MMTTSQNDSCTARWSIPVTLFLAVMLLVGVTLQDYGVTWDEPPYFYASDLHINWIVDFGQNLARGNALQSISDESINAAWHWNPYNVPHPPFSRIVSGITRSSASHFLDQFSAYRIGPSLFFASLVVVMYLWMNELFGRATGIFAAFALILTPNLFGYAHIAVTDLPLTTMWFLSAYCFWKGLTNWKWSLVLGVVWGLALSTKFPALLIPIPLILWAHLFQREKYTNNIFTMLFLAPVVMFIINPYLWHQPGMRILEFLYEGISRAYRPETNYTIYFLGQVYFTNQLPWYYPFYMIGVTTPEAFVALAALGLVVTPWLQKGRAAALLFFINGAFVIMLALMPGAVLHDGVRQMLSALPFIVALASAGFFILTTWMLKMARRFDAIGEITNLESKIAGLLLLSSCSLSVLDLYFYHPFQLSYYNRFVGGLRGAYERGFEVTYFMEAINPKVVKAINDNLPKNAAVYASVSKFMLTYYQNEGRLRPDIKVSDGRQFDFYFLLNRRSVLSSRERNLMEALVQPYLSVRVDGVLLVALFDFRKPVHDPVSR